MAVTKGHGNPKWTRDETLLALELYLITMPNIPGPTDRRIKELSNLLNRLPIHSAEIRKQSFRNPDGVVFKLQNLKSVGTGRGLMNTSQLDRKIWQEFASRPDEVKKLAHSIRQATELLGEDYEPIDEEDEFEFAEGKVLFRFHRVRERKASLRKSVLDKKRKTEGLLSCDCCDKRPNASLGEIGEAIFEVHHLKPLSETGESKTKLEDVALLCADCHRLIHRLSKADSKWYDVESLCKKLKG